MTKYLFALAAVTLLAVACGGGPSMPTTPEGPKTDLPGAPSAEVPGAPSAEAPKPHEEKK